MTAQIKVLIADDNRHYRQIVKNILALAPQLKVIDEAANGDEAIQKANLLHPDVILLDVSMPGIDGIDAAAEIHQVHPAIKILMLSVYTDRKLVLSALKNGAHGYLVKGRTGSEELITAIEWAFHGRAVISSYMTGWLLDEIHS